MGSFKSKSKTETDQTTTPVTPPWIAQPVEDYTGVISDFMGMDPSQFVAPASPLQQQAFGQAPNLGGWKPAITDAIGMAKTAVGTPTPGYAAPTIAPAGSASASSWSAPNLGSASQVGPVNLADAHTFSPESSLTNLQAYQDPYIGNVVDTTLRNYDAQTGRQGAAMQAQAAKAGAFGGSRYGLAQGQFAADTDRLRAGTEAGLRSDAFRFGSQMSADDANRRQQASLFGAAAGNTRDLTQGQMDLARLTGNTAAENQFKLSQADLAARAASEGAASRGQVSMFNTGLAADQASQQAAMEARAREFSASQAAADANRALEAAGLVGNLGLAGGAGERADLGLTADLGTLQRAIEEAKANAIPTQLQIAGQLYGNLPYPAFVGSNMQGVTTTKGTMPWGPPVIAGLAGAAQAAATGGMKF